MSASRESFLLVCRALEGTSYGWGGKKPPQLDCSGLVTYSLLCAGGPDLRQTHNSDALWAELPETLAPRAGDLAFYGPQGDPQHVVVCLGGEDGEIIGANGGGKNTRTLIDAQLQRACVKRKPSPKYRPDLMGYRSTAQWWA